MASSALRRQRAPPRILINGLWANPSGALLEKIYREARREVPQTYSADPDPALARAGWLRKVSAVYLRRLKAAGIYVEGA